MIHIKSDKEEHMLCGAPKYNGRTVTTLDLLLGNDVNDIEVDVDHYCNHCFCIYRIHKSLCEIGNVPDLHRFSLHEILERDS